MLPIDFTGKRAGLKPGTYIRLRGGPSMLDPFKPTGLKAGHYKTHRGPGEPDADKP